MNFPFRKGSKVYIAKKENKEMRITLYMAMTLDGFIARDDDSTDFASKNEWKSFSAMLKKVKYAVIGKRTYNIMAQGKEFEKIKNCHFFVMTKEKIKEDNKSITITNKSPKDLIKELEKRGIKQVCICGGGMINSAFLETGLIDEMYLDVMPVMIGKGIPLFGKKNTKKVTLELKEVKELGKNEMQLHYRVKK